MLTCLILSRSLSIKQVKYTLPHAHMTPISIHNRRLKILRRIRATITPTTTTIIQHQHRSRGTKTMWLPTSLTSRRDAKDDPPRLWIQTQSLSKGLFAIQGALLTRPRSSNIHGANNRLRHYLCRSLLHGHNERSHHLHQQINGRQEATGKMVEQKWKRAE